MEKQEKKRNHKILQIPILGPVIGCIVGLIICELIIGGLIGTGMDVWIRHITMPQVMAGEAQLLFGSLLSILGAVLIIFVYKKWFQGEFKGCYSGNWGDKQLLIYTLICAGIQLAILIVGYVTAGIQTPTIYMFLNALMAGVCEETCTRLIPISLMMRNGADKKSIRTAIIVSSIAFGLTHTVNALMQSGAGTAMQVVVTIGMGVLFGALYLRTGNILISMIFHTVYDFFGVMQASAKGLIVDNGASAASIEGYIVPAIQIISFTVCGILILKGRTKEIDDVWKERWNNDNQ